MITGVFLFRIIPPFIIYASILIEMYSKLLKKYSNTFAKYLYFQSNTFIKHIFLILYSVFMKLQSICIQMVSIQPQVWLQPKVSSIFENTRSAIKITGCPLSSHWTF